MLSKQIKSQIRESKNISDILKLIENRTWLLLDLDMTIMTADGVGSDPWFEKLISHACQIIPDNVEAMLLVVAIYHSVQHHVRTQAVEPEIVSIIRDLQARGVTILGITARDGALINTTIRQLREIGVDLSINRDENENRIALGNNPSNRSVYHQGIIYCCGHDKGQCLDVFLDKCEQLPAHILMADDKAKHLAHVRDVVVRRGINFEGLRYGHLDHQVKNFNMDHANDQLAHLFGILPVPTQKAITQLKIIPADIKITENKYSAFFATDPFRPVSPRPQNSKNSVEPRLKLYK